MDFGEYSFDPSSGELTGPSGVSRLAPQVASVLRILTERAGQVVTRTELRDALWPDTTVEFDQGLNFCIRQLRIALDDDAEQPRYIETLPRRGYRFIMPTGNGAPRDRAAASSPATPRLRASLATWLIVLLIVLGVIVATRRYGMLSNPALAVITFDTPVGDTALANYSARLAEELVASVTRARASEVAVMGPSFTSRFPGTRANPDSVRQALNATHILSGSVTRAEGGIRVFAQLIRTRDRRHVMAIRLIDTTDRAPRAAYADSIGRRAASIILGLERAR